MSAAANSGDGKTTRGPGFRYESAHNRMFGNGRAAGCLEVFGTFMGAVVDGEAIGADAAWHHLVAAPDVPTREALLRRSIGRFVVVAHHQGGAQFFTSAVHPGIYIAKVGEEVLISEDEVAQYRHVGRGSLDELQVLNTLLSHRALRSPYRTLFDDVRRVPAGHAIDVHRGKPGRPRLYIQYPADELSFERLGRRAAYAEFARRLDATVAVIRDFAGPRKLNVLLSGGVDSAVLLAALRRVGGDVNCIHWAISQGVMPRMTEILGERLGVPLEFVPFGAEKIEELDADRIRRFFSGTVGASMPWATASFAFSRRFGGADTPPILLSGQNLDSLYFVDTFAPSTGTTFRKRLPAILKTIPERVRYTDVFIRSIAALQHNKERGVRRVLRIPRALPYEYVRSTVLPVYEHVVPLERGILLPDLVSGLEGPFEAMKVSENVRPLFIDEIQFEQFRQGTLDVSAGHLNHLIRVAKWLRFVQNTHRYYAGVESYEGTRRITPFAEGPMLEFFLQYRLDLRDTVVIKEFCHRYFREVTGMSFAGLLREARRGVQGSIAARVARRLTRGRAVGRRRSKRSHEIAVSLEFWRKTLGDSEPLLLKLVEHPEIKRYITDVWTDLQKASTLPKGRAGEVDRLVNMELVLRSVHTRTYELHATEA